MEVARETTTDVVLRPETSILDRSRGRIRPVDALEPDEEGEQKCYSPDPKWTVSFAIDGRIGGEIDDEIAALARGTH